MIWLLESQSTHSSSVFAHLDGSVSIRRVASILSLTRLLKICDDSNLPRVILLGEEHGNDDERQVLKFKLDQSWPDIQLVITSFAAGYWVELAQKSQLMFFDFDKNCVTRLVQLLEAFGRVGGVKQNKQDSVQTSQTNHGFINPGNIGFQQNVLLSPKEQKLLQVLWEFRGDFVSRSELLARAWQGLKVSERTLDSHISRLRRKLEDSSEIRIESAYGKGYCIP